MNGSGELGLIGTDYPKAGPVVGQADKQLVALIVALELHPIEARATVVSSVNGCHY